MKQSTAKKLIRMTNELYEKEALDFDKTRNNLWEKEILDFAEKIKHGSSVLDLGCGNARLLALLSSKCKNQNAKLQSKNLKYLGIDNSKKLITLNRKKYGNSDATVGANLRFEVGDGLKFPPKADQPMAEKEKFDYVICNAVLHHIPSEKLQLAFLENIYNSLSDGGQILISVWNRWQDRYKKYFTDKKPFPDMEYTDIIVPWKQSGQARYIHVFRVNELKSMAEKVGLKKIQVFASRHGKKTNLKEALNIYLLGEK